MLQKMSRLIEWEVFASRDDNGTIKVTFFCKLLYNAVMRILRVPGMQVWDTRQNSCCNNFSPHEDYISDMEFVASTSQILGTRYMHIFL